MYACALANDAPCCDANGRSCVVVVSRSSCLFAQGAEYAAAVAQSIAEDNARAGPVFISGATGSSASVVNGYYEPTEEKGADGRVMYAKRGDGGVCIEHVEGFYWRIKDFSIQGQELVAAYVCGCCSLESCESSVWKVLDPSIAETSSFVMCIKSSRYPDDAAVKMLTGPAAQLEVSICGNCVFGCHRFEMTLFADCSAQFQGTWPNFARFRCISLFARV